MPYSTKQRTRNGLTERQCRYCAAWYPLEGFAKGPAKCIGGRRARCKLCYRDWYEARYRSHRTRRAA